MSVRVVLVGHVDHGKSTLVGRLLSDTGQVPATRAAAVAQACAEAGKPFEYAFLLDALEEERSQGVTIDTMQVRFRTPRREFVLIDAPGHREFIKNMVTGATSAEAAILLVDVAEGVREQTRRHACLLGLVGIRRVILVVNKMDLVGHAPEAFDRIAAECRGYMDRIGVKTCAVIPVVAREGVNVASIGSGAGGGLGWYAGPTVLEALEALDERPDLSGLPLRFPVQGVFKFDDRRIVAGRVATGTLAAGDRLLFSPSGRVLLVRSVERWNGRRSGPAEPGESIGLMLEDDVFLERGEVASLPDRPPRVGAAIRARIFWLGESPFVCGKDYHLRLATGEVRCRLSGVEEVVDAGSLSEAGDRREVAQNEVGTVSLALERPVAFDAFGDAEETGRFVLADGHSIVGGGVVLS